MTGELSPDTIVFFENRVTTLSEARVGILTHALNYGTGVFEGVRGYWNEPENQLFLMRPREHFERWKQNCGILRIEVPPSAAELGELTADLLRRNGFRGDVYIKPLAYKSSQWIGIHMDDESAFAIVPMLAPAYLDSSKGLHAGVTSWRRIEDNAIPGRGKICGSYVNGALASDEVRRNGFDEAILLTEAGHVAEGASCNIFLVRHGKLITPPASENILEGITRDSVMELARKELHLEVIERPVDRSELYVCDEMFFTGTMVEVAPVIRVDHRPVGSGEIGPVTTELRRLYNQAAHGRLKAYRHWLMPVYEPVATVVDSVQYSTMIDSKQAFQFAKQQATGMLGERPFRLEEIERDTYKGREVWRVTLGYPQDQTLVDAVSPLRAIGIGPLEYKLFLIDATNGDLVAMKLREPLPQ